jgi:hypothetical protein
MVGTKYLPPILPTLLTAKVPLLKSSCTNLPAFDLVTKSFKSLFIYNILLS